MPDKQKSSKIVALITRVHARVGTDFEPLKVSLVNLMLTGAEAPGFWSGEIIPPDPIQTPDEWRLVMRFSSAHDLHAWRESPSRIDLVSELSECSNPNGKGDAMRHPVGAEPDAEIKVSEELVDADGSHGTVATSIVTEVKPGSEQEFFAWQTKIQIAQAKFPGYRGVYWQPPSPGLPHRWSTLLRFDSPESLESWFRSEERSALLAERSAMVHATIIQEVTSTFPGWFPVDSSGQPPRKWKTAMLILAALFPVVIIEIRVLNPMLKELNAALVLFINLVGSVTMTTWVMMPFLVARFGWWLSPDKSRIKDVNIRGLLIMLLTYAIELLLFWRFLPTFK